MIIAGQGVLYAEATDELLALADLLDTPVMTTTDARAPSRGPRPGIGVGARSTRPWPPFSPGNRHIFAVGTSLTRHNISTPIIPPGRHHPRHQRCATSTRPTTRSCHPRRREAHARAVDRGVKDRLSGKAHETGARPTIARLKPNGCSAGTPSSVTRAPINPYFVMSEFMRVIPSEDAIVTHDSAAARPALPMYVAKKPPAIWLGKSHQLGTASASRSAPSRRPRQDVRQLHGRRCLRHDRLDFESASGAASRSPRSSSTIRRWRSRPTRCAPRTKSTAPGTSAQLRRHRQGTSALSERVDDPAEVGHAILRARKQNENGTPASSIHPAPRPILHRRGAA